MSSQNVVTENKTKALIVANGDECDLNILNDLLSWDPFVLALDGAANRLHSLGLNIDAVVGDFDSLRDAATLKTEQHPIEIISRPDQSKTDLEKGIELLIERGYTEAEIVWASGKRLDHTLANVFCLAKYVDSINCKLVDNHSVLYPIKNIFSKWYAAGQAISLIPVGICRGIKTSNLKYSLEDESLNIFSRLGTSNEVLQDGEVRIDIKEGTLLLVESN